MVALLPKVKKSEEQPKAQEDEAHGIHALLDIPAFLIVAEFLLQQTFVIGSVCRDWFGFVYCELAMSTVFSHKLSFTTSNTESLSAIFDRPTNPIGPTGGQILTGLTRRLHIVCPERGPD